MSYSNSSIKQKSDSVSVYNTRTGNVSKTRLIRLQNGHYRRVVDISNKDEKEILFRTCACACPTPRNEETRKTYMPPLNNVSTVAYRKRIYSSFGNKDGNDTGNNESITEHEDPIRTFSETTSRQESTIDDKTETSINSKETDDGNQFGRLFEELEEKEDELIEEKEEELIEEKEEELIEEKEEELIEEKEEITPENKTLIMPSKTLMKGIKTNIYFLSNKEKIQVLMCYNYKCDAVVFEKDTFLRYLYIKSINNIILNERMIEQLCKNENLKYILACNSIVVESSDFIKPLIIEFESSTSKNIFVKHIKHNSQKEMDINKFNEYMRDLKSNEKLRLKKVERFHSINLAAKK
ncbi:conserved Plasmodium protein, unknown function [Plasmodium berghei]|uniref:Uncharacterized protein n=2 Tax=Plasmodium berghei TaxID=5821 RepID=A0A509AH84_PLABA|nr:conserved Plasmodium protein, unknown function [Plasmodium berghei ANKA]CXI16419.1 conserved Plasmodium protein, unknown function [Plasmodium berghei]SCM19625.1 conserved Plasmodium protein, unknown function [Plasmodium berghei]SCN23368.1 conserved Plasmodium protein, unknown function [Plasmodium berghei]SCO59633.1 conserved Plasmodium protein, unknown function [Plasmodium berghei]VUC54735.1 conserved Plasmodium protein, unknown function [Plasmodium berghei ANKA]|eukprot:XP_034420560.1 conserved Plasmodium protein, unknown function [Plasmodium berghei ANKA]